MHLIYFNFFEDDDSAHLMGDTLDFEFYLGSEKGSLSLNGTYSWIKCNRNFRGYYLTTYTEYNFKAVEYVMANSNNVILFFFLTIDNKLK